MVSLLASENGWETEGVKINKAKNRDGKLMTMSEFAGNYGMEQGIYSSRLRSQLPIRLRDVADEDKPQP